MDQPRAVRAGEQLDAARLRDWLGRTLGSAGELTIEQFPSGHSNLTYLVRQGDLEWVLRRPPFGTNVKSAHDMEREHRILSRLAPVWAKAPRPVALCADVEVLGAPFYLMQRVHGVILRKDAALDPITARRLCEAFVDTLAELHALDPAAAGLGDLGRPDGYVSRQVSGWSRRYQDARTDDIPALEAAAAWLAGHIPVSGPATLLHNDFKYDNLVLDPADPARVLAVLDWEMSTLGDPLMDLGTALSYWVEANDPPGLQQIRFCPTHVPGSATRGELARRYAERSGRDVSQLAFYYCFGLFKTAVVAQQIYARYRRGVTQDARFAHFLAGVRALADQAAAASRMPDLA